MYTHYLYNKCIHVNTPGLTTLLKGCNSYHSCHHCQCTWMFKTNNKVTIIFNYKSCICYHPCNYLPLLVELSRIHVITYTNLLIYLLSGARWFINQYITACPQRTICVHHVFQFQKKKKEPGG